MGPTGMGWKFSQIDGDPVLGEGVKSYFTRQFRNSLHLDSIKAEVDQVAEVLWSPLTSLYERAKKALEDS